MWTVIFRVKLFWSPSICVQRDAHQGHNLAEQEPLEVSPSVPTMRLPGYPTSQLSCPTDAVPQMRPHSVLPSRFSTAAGMPEAQELRRAAELRARLRTVSEDGVRAATRSRAGGSSPASCPQSPELRASRGCLPSCLTAGHGPLQVLPQRHRETDEPEQPELGAGEEPGSGT